MNLHDLVLEKKKDSKNPSRLDSGIFKRVRLVAEMIMRPHFQN